MAARILREQRHARRFAVATFAFTTSRSSLRTLILRSTRQFRPVNIPRRNMRTLPTARYADVV